MKLNGMICFKFVPTLLTWVDWGTTWKTRQVVLVSPAFKWIFTKVQVFSKSSHWNLLCYQKGIKLQVFLRNPSFQLGSYFPIMKYPFWFFSRGFPYRLVSSFPIINYPFGSSLPKPAGFFSASSPVIRINSASTLPCKEINILSFC